MRVIGSEKLNDLVSREVSMLDKRGLTITPEMLESTQAMQQYYKEVQSFQNLLSISAQGLAYLSPNTGPNLQRAQEDGYREMIIRKTGLSRQEISDFVNEIKDEEMKRSSTRITTKNALEILMKNLAVLVPRFYKDGTIIDPQLNDDRIAKDPLKFLDWFVKYRPNSRYRDSFIRVRSHIKCIGEKSWQTPLDRDPIISRRMRIRYKLMKIKSDLRGTPFYVIYGLMQKRSLFTGLKLSKSIFEVGYFTSPESMRLIRSSHIKSLPASIHKTSNIYFALSYFKFLRREGIISKDALFTDYFEAVPVDIAHSMKEMEDLEVFYTIYANRKNAPYSFDLNENFMFNAIVGDLFGSRFRRGVIADLNKMPIEPLELKHTVYVSKESLDAAILYGLDKKDLYWYFRESKHTINKILDYHYPSKEYWEIRREVITPYLEELSLKRLDHSELKYFFYRSRQSQGVIFSNYKDPSFQLDLVPYSDTAIYNLLKNTLGSVEKYDDIIFESWIKPLLFKMHELGFITKNTLINAIKTGYRFPLIDQDPKFVQDIKGKSFRWIFQLLFSSDIIKILSENNYGSLSDGATVVPISLLKDIGLYTEGDKKLNNNLQRRLLVIIESMFFTRDLSEIHRILNTNIL